MSRSEYREQLAWLNTEVVLLAELVVDRYDDALRAAATGDRWLAEAVVDGTARSTSGISSSNANVPT